MHPPSLVLVFLCSGIFASSQSSSGSSGDPLQYVDPLIGSTDGGNVFVGATLPYGMAKAVANSDSGSAQGGFVADNSNVTGFSSLHDSGTGGSLSLGNFELFAYPGCPDDIVNKCPFNKPNRRTHYTSESLAASPGYFALSLVSGVHVEMTSTQHASLYRFSFPAASANASSPLFLMDLTDLSNSRQDNASISVDPDSGRMTGGGRFVPSFAQGTYEAFFCVDFQGADLRDSGIWVDSRAGANVPDLKISRSINGFPLPGGGWARFHRPSSGSIYARVGLSFIDSDKACQNAESEIADFDFEGIHSAAVGAWRSQLTPITVSTAGVDTSQLTNFYSGIYRAYVNPQNYTGENPKWQSSEPYFDSFYCIWDLFRSTFPFLTITDPEALEQMIRTLIDVYRHEGWLPDCRMTFSRGYTQGGSNADVVLADGRLKGLSGAIDWETGYAAVVKDAQVEPYDWCCEGRGGLDSWDRLGYIPVEDFDYKGFGTHTRSISRTLEYAYNDFTIAQLASSLGGHSNDEQRYLSSSENWKNLWRAEQRSYRRGSDTGFVGFFQPKYLNETWGFQEPLYCSNIDTNATSVCSLQNTASETYESSIWEYSFYVPHNMGDLISYFGGPSAFVRRLDYMHDQNITYIGNEPSFLTVYQYHYAGRPGLSAKRAHFYIPRYFQPTRGGLPGNDDSGTMGSFVAFSMIGLVPSPGQNVYFIIPPFFESVNITSPVTGNTATIRNVNFDPSFEAIYIQSAMLDGEMYTKNWIDHSFFTEGKELVLTLGRNESGWGTEVENLPPSLGDYVGYGGTNGNTTTRLRPRNWLHDDTELERKAYVGL